MARVKSAARLFLFVIFIIFLELSFFFEKQFLHHRTPLKIGSGLEHCSVVLNVFQYDKALQKSPPKKGP